MCEKHPDDAVWKLSAQLSSELPAQIQAQLMELVEDNERNPSVESHNFAGFWLPSVDFRGANFTKPVYFNHAMFLGEAVFSELSFGSEADFSHSCFRGNADFMSMAFEGWADFQWARFGRDTLFSDARFSGDVDFGDAFIEGDLVFEAETFEGEANFRGVKIRKEGRLVFSGADLSHGRLVGLNLDRVDFRNVTWFRPGGETWKSVRNALWDEFRPLQEGETRRHYLEVADNYRQLVLNYEGRRDFESAEDFHIGEMEMRRLSVPDGGRFFGIRRWWHRKLSLIALYRFASDYGTSYVKPIRLLLVGMVLFAALLPLPGVGLKLQGTTQIESYASVWRGSGPVKPNLWAEARLIGMSLLSSVDTATFQRNAEFIPAYPWGRALAIVETLLTSSLFALFLLAIRRRFRR